MDTWLFSSTSSYRIAKVIGSLLFCSFFSGYSYPLKAETSTDDKQTINLSTGAARDFGSHPSKFTVYNDEIYFSADASYSWKDVDLDDSMVIGRELFRHSPLTGETVLVADLFPGYSETGTANSSNPDKLKAINGQLYFLAEDSNGVKNLWKITAINSEPELVQPDVVNYFSANDVIYFVRHSTIDGWQLYLNGDENGDSLMVVTLGEPSQDPQQKVPYHFLHYEDNVYFYHYPEATDELFLAVLDLQDYGVTNIETAGWAHQGRNANDLVLKDGLLYYNNLEGTIKTYNPIGDSISQLSDINDCGFITRFSFLGDDIVGLVQTSNQYLKDLSLVRYSFTDDVCSTISTENSNFTGSNLYHLDFLLPEDDKLFFRFSHNYDPTSNNRFDYVSQSFCYLEQTSDELSCVASDEGNFGGEQSHPLQSNFENAAFYDGKLFMNHGLNGYEPHVFDVESNEFELIADINHIDQSSDIKRFDVHDGSVYFIEDELIYRVDDASGEHEVFLDCRQIFDSYAIEPRCEAVFSAGNYVYIVPIQYPTVEQVVVVYDTTTHSTILVNQVLGSEGNESEAMLSEIRQPKIMNETLFFNTYDYPNSGSYLIDKETWKFRKLHANAKETILVGTDIFLLTQNWEDFSWPSNRFRLEKLDKDSGRLEPVTSYFANRVSGITSRDSTLFLMAKTLDTGGDLMLLEVDMLNGEVTLRANLSDVLPVTRYGDDIFFGSPTEMFFAGEHLMLKITHSEDCRGTAYLSAFDIETGDLHRLDETYVSAFPHQVDYQFKGNHIYFQDFSGFWQVDLESFDKTKLLDLFDAGSCESLGAWEELNGKIYSNGKVFPFNNEVTIFDHNFAPTINLDVADAAIRGETLVLDASASFDLDGDSLTFSWEQTGQQGVTISELDTSIIELDIPANFAEDTLHVSLSISDGVNISSRSISINVANAAGSGVGDYVAYDADGDGAADLMLRIGIRNVTLDINGEDITFSDSQIGSQITDIPIAGDFDGDGIADYAVRRPSTARWYIKNSDPNGRNNPRGDGIQRFHFGKQISDIPVSGDFDGDGIEDINFRRPNNQYWYVKNSTASNFNSSRGDGIQRVRFGLRSEDIPISGDFDGDGIADFAVRRPSSSYWYIKNSSGSNFNSARADGIQRMKLGRRVEDIPIAADFDGDGITDIGVRRPSQKVWYVRYSGSGDIVSNKLGRASEDIPIVADYDGDGLADFAVFRPSRKVVYIEKSSDKDIVTIQINAEERVIPFAAPMHIKMQMAAN